MKTATRHTVAHVRAQLAVGRSAVRVRSARPLAQRIDDGQVDAVAYEPMFDVYDESGKTTYVHMTPEKTKRVVHEHLVNGQVVREFTIGSSLK